VMTPTAKRRTTFAVVAVAALFAFWLYMALG
jgi:hypothetical protein